MPGMFQDKIDRLEVMHQHTQHQHGRESCSYHAFKNMILCLQYTGSRGYDEPQLKIKVQDAQLFKHLFDQLKPSEKKAIDFTTIQFMQTINAISREHQQLTVDKKPITHALFTDEKLEQNDALDVFDGKQKISVVNLPRAKPKPLKLSRLKHVQEMPDYCMTGFPDNLIMAATIANLARNKGRLTHVFACGIEAASPHWVTVLLIQENKNTRTWKYLDSVNNDSHKVFVVNALKKILNKDELQLRKYLVAVYRSVPFSSERYRVFFDPDSGQALRTLDNQLVEHQISDIELVNLFEYYSEPGNLTELLNDLTIRFKFFIAAGLMQDSILVETMTKKQALAEWSIISQEQKMVKSFLNSLKDLLECFKDKACAHDLIKMHAGVEAIALSQDQKIQALSHYLLSIHDIYAPDCDAESAFSSQEEKSDSDDASENEYRRRPRYSSASPSSSPASVAIQVAAAEEALLAGSPPPTMSFLDRLVKGIMGLWQGMKQTLNSWCRSLGII